MNSMAVGMMPPRVMMAGTAAMAASAVLKRQSRSTLAFGRGSSFRVILVKTPSVPSEPTINCNRL